MALFALPVTTYFVVALFSAVVKVARENIPTGIVISVRYLIGALILFTCVGGWSQVKENLRITESLGHIRRAGLELMSFFCMAYAAPYLSLADFTAISFTIPLLLAILSRFILGEHIPYLRIIAMIFGFLGVVIVVRPGTSQFSFEMVVLLVGCLFAAFK